MQTQIALSCGCVIQTSIVYTSLKIICHTLSSKCWIWRTISTGSKIILRKANIFFNILYPAVTIPLSLQSTGWTIQLEKYIN